MLNPKLLTNIVNKAKVLQDMCEGRTNHISFILNGKKIVAAGWNSMCKTDAFAYRNGYKYPYMHSEVHAIRNFKYKPSELKGCTLVNIRLSKCKYQKLLNARPCKNCMRLIRAFEIGTVIYSTEYGFKRL